MAIDVNDLWQELGKHRGHKFAVQEFGASDEPCNIVLACTTCNEILLSADKPEQPQHISEILPKVVKKYEFGQPRHGTTSRRDPEERHGTPDVCERPAVAEPGGDSSGNLPEDADRGGNPAGSGSDGEPTTQADAGVITPDIAKMEMVDCKKFLGIDPFGHLPEKYKHLGNASVGIWRRQVMNEIKRREKPATQTPEVGDREGGCNCPHFCKYHDSDGNLKDLSETPGEPSLDSSDKWFTPGLGDLGLFAPGHMRGFVLREAAEQIGQRHEDVAFPTGGRGTLVVRQIFREQPAPEGLVLAELEMIPAEADVPMIEGKLPELTSPAKGWPSPMVPLFVKTTDGNPVTAQTLKELLHTISPSERSDYIKSKHLGWCPDCGDNAITLLMPREAVPELNDENSMLPGAITRLPMFYICACGWVGEIGVGPVTEEE